MKLLLSSSIVIVTFACAQTVFADWVPVRAFKANDQTFDYHHVRSDINGNRVGLNQRIGMNQEKLNYVKGYAATLNANLAGKPQAGAADVAPGVACARKASAQLNKALGCYQQSAKAGPNTMMGFIHRSKGNFHAWRANQNVRPLVPKAGLRMEPTATPPPP